MNINLNIKDEAAEAYVAHRGKGDNNMTDEEFIVACLLQEIQEGANAYILSEATNAAIESVSLIESVEAA